MQRTPHTVRLKRPGAGKHETGHGGPPCDQAMGEPSRAVRKGAPRPGPRGRSDRFGGLRQLFVEQLGEPGDVGDIAEVPGSGVDGLAQAGVHALGADLLGDLQGAGGEHGGLLGLPLEEMDGGHADEVERVGALVLVVLAEQLHGLVHDGLGERGVRGAAAA